MKPFLEKNKKYIFYFFQISLFVFAISFLAGIDYVELKELRSGVPLFLLLLIGFHFGRSVRLHLLLNEFICQIRFRDSLYVYYIGLSLGIASPGKIGELYRVKLIKEITGDLEKAAGAFLLDKIIDISSMVGIIVFFTFSIFDVNILLSILIAFFCQFIVYVLARYSLNLIVSVQYFNNFAKLFMKKIAHVTSHIPPVKIKTLAILYLTCCLWLLFIASIFALVQPLFSTNLDEMIYVFIVNSISTAVPISFLGFGVRELILSLFSVKEFSVDFIAVLTIAFSAVYVVSFLAGGIAYGCRKFF